MAVMETQPIAILLMFISPPFTGTIRPWPLETYMVTLLIVGLHWWALLTYALTPRYITVQQNTQFRVLGLIIAYAAALLPQAYTPNFLSFVVTLGLVTWFWKRGLDKARLGLSDENLVPTFRVGFIALLVFFVFVFLAIDLDNNSVLAGLLAMLGNALPIFFISGLIALSLTRIAIIRRDNQRSAVNSALDPTRNWLVVLTLLWIGVVALALTLEIFSFQSIADIFLPIWGLFGVLALVVLEAILFVLTPLFRFFAMLIHNPPSINGGVLSPLPPAPPGQPPQPPFILILATRFLLLAIAVGLFVLLIRLILRHLKNRVQDDDSEEEIRESLSIRSVLQTRRQEQKQTVLEAPQLEELPPNSARAHYRELLQALAWNKATIARQSSETPNEYQTRLLSLLQQNTPGETEQDGQLPDAALLEELTRAYDEERYGGKQILQARAAYSQSWLNHFIERLTGKTVSRS